MCISSQLLPPSLILHTFGHTPPLLPSLNSSSVWKTMSSSSTSSLGGIGPRLALSLPPLMDITCCRRVCFRAVPDIEAGLTSRRGPRCVRGSADASRTRMANKNQPILIFDCREAGILQNLVRQLSPTTPDLGQPVASDVPRVVLLQPAARW